jgi:hypothetical protein
MSHEIVAVDGDVAVARVEVDYATGAEYRDLWLIRPGSRFRRRKPGRAAGSAPRHPCFAAARFTD